MKLSNLIENQEKKLGDLEIDGKIVAPNGVRRDNWEGHMYCNGNFLTSLEGAPRRIGGDFWCSINKLTSLEGCPQQVGKNFWCTGNQLISLKGAPQQVGGDFMCGNNKLTSLEGAPQHVGWGFICDSNQLTSLKGAPKHIGGSFWCDRNQLTSLEGIHEQILEINGHADFEKNPIKSHVLGLLLIKGLTSVKLDNDRLSVIINKYLPLGDIMACQNELIDAGLEDFAQI